VTKVEPWEEVSIAGLQITAAPARHGVPEVTFVLQGAGTTVFFGGRHAAHPELDQVAQRFPDIDLALLPVNGLRIRPAFNRRYQRLSDLRVTRTARDLRLVQTRTTQSTRAGCPSAP
jgi:L-ascorbate metabolism protein UlaG (beta-lactamase superfamily)